jgi:hypothetical protein
MSERDGWSGLFTVSCIPRCLLLMTCSTYLVIFKGLLLNQLSISFLVVFGLLSKTFNQSVSFRFLWSACHGIFTFYILGGIPKVLAGLVIVIFRRPYLRFNAGSQYPTFLTNLDLYMYRHTHRHSRTIQAMWLSYTTKHWGDAAQHPPPKKKHSRFLPPPFHQ